MPENEATETVETETETENTESNQESVESETDEPFREKWEAQRKVNRDLETKLKALSQIEKKFEARLQEELANQNKSAEEKAVDAARREAEQAANARANVRIVRSELKAAATGKVKNPTLALKLIDMSEIDVDDDGEPNSDAIANAIDALLTDYPELAVSAPGFGSADQGAKGRAAAPTQLTKNDLENMTPQEINDARRAGRLDKILGKTT